MYICHCFLSLSKSTSVSKRYSTKGLRFHPCTANSIDYLKSDSHLPKKCVICLIENPLGMMKIAFYFIVKVLFVLKIFKFLSRLFGHVGKTV